MSEYQRSYSNKKIGVCGQGEEEGGEIMYKRESVMENGGEIKYDHGNSSKGNGEE